MQKTAWDTSRPGTALKCVPRRFADEVQEQVSHQLSESGQCSNESEIFGSCRDSSLEINVAVIALHDGGSVLCQKGWFRAAVKAIEVGLVQLPKHFRGDAIRGAFTKLRPPNGSVQESTKKCSACFLSARSLCPSASHSVLDFSSFHNVPVPGRILQKIKVELLRCVSLWTEPLRPLQVHAAKFYFDLRPPILAESVVCWLCGEISR